MLAALGYQESQLRQEARSPVGAIGVMQLMPATGRSMQVGDIKLLEPNVHAGARYLDRLMTRYFQGAGFDEMNRALFAFAAYNAGPTRMQQMRRLAGERGLDPDVWFNNVELVVAERIGLETTTYVRNILKYYVAYSLIEQTRSTRREALQAVPDAARERRPTRPRRDLERQLAARAAAAARPNGSPPTPGRRDRAAGNRSSPTSSFPRAELRGARPTSGALRPEDLQRRRDAVARGRWRTRSSTCPDVDDPQRRVIAATSGGVRLRQRLRAERPGRRLGEVRLQARAGSSACARYLATELLARTSTWS